MRFLIEVGSRLFPDEDAVDIIEVENPNIAVNMAMEMAWSFIEDTDRYPEVRDSAEDGFIEYARENPDAYISLMNWIDDEIEDNMTYSVYEINEDVCEGVTTQELQTILDSISSIANFRFRYTKEKNYGALE